MVFPKKIAPEYDLSCIIGKDDISFCRKYDLSRQTENERWSFLKNTRKSDIFLKPSEIMGLPKRATPAHGLSCTTWKDGIFSENMIIFAWAESKRRPRKYMKTWCIAQQRKTGNLIYRVKVLPLLKFMWLEIFYNQQSSILCTIQPPGAVFGGMLERQ